jgi:hypothetical protein
MLDILNEKKAHGGPTYVVGHHSLKKKSYD